MGRERDTGAVMSRVLAAIGWGGLLTVCLVSSCIVAGVSLKREGRDFFSGLYRDAGHWGESYEPAPKEINREYSLAFGEDGAVFFNGGGIYAVLPPGFKPVTPAGLEDRDFVFDYYLRSPDGSVEVRLARHYPSSRVFYYDPNDRRKFYNDVRDYALKIAGEAAVNASPPLYLASEGLAFCGADVGVEGCYPYTPDRRKENEYDGEYFAFLARGYENVVVIVVACKPFRRDAAYEEGRAVIKTLRFN